MTAEEVLTCGKKAQRFLLQGMKQMSDSIKNIVIRRYIYGEL